MPRCAVACRNVIAVEVSISDLDGTQSVSTQAPPGPSSSTTVTSAPSCAPTSAASYPPGPPPRMAILCRGMVTISNPGCSDVPAAASGGGTPYAVPRGTVRGLRQQHGPGPDAGTLPALTAARFRLA